MNVVIDSEKRKSVFSFLKKPSKQVFWLWIAYQTIKGTLTLSLIWIPLFWLWMNS